MPAETTIAVKKTATAAATPVDPDNPFHVTLAGSSVSMEATATAAAPAYVEGSANPLSQDLTGNLRVKDAAANTVLGTTAGAAVITDANGTIQQYLRGLVKLLITAGTIVLGAGTAVIGFVNLITGQTGVDGGAGAASAKTLRVVNASDGPTVAALGAIADAAATDSTSSWSMIALLKGLMAQAISTAAVLIYRSDTYFNIVLAAPTTTLVKSGAGTLAKIVINKPLANGVITMYDSLTGSGTLIGTITQPAALLSTGPDPVAYDVGFSIGLTIVTSGAAQDITVCYK